MRSFVFKKIKRTMKEYNKKQIESLKNQIDKYSEELQKSRTDLIDLEFNLRSKNPSSLILKKDNSISNMDQAKINDNKAGVNNNKIESEIQIELNNRNYCNENNASPILEYEEKYVEERKKNIELQSQVNELKYNLENAQVQFDIIKMDHEKALNKMIEMNTEIQRITNEKVDLEQIALNLKINQNIGNERMSSEPESVMRISKPFNDFNIEYYRSKANLDFKKSKQNISSEINLNIDNKISNNVNEEFNNSDNEEINPKRINSNFENIDSVSQYNNPNEDNQPPSLFAEILESSEGKNIPKEFSYRDTFLFGPNAIKLQDEYKSLNHPPSLEIDSQNKTENIQKINSNIEVNQSINKNNNIQMNEIDNLNIDQTNSINRNQFKDSQDQESIEANPMNHVSINEKNTNLNEINIRQDLKIKADQLEKNENINILLADNFNINHEKEENKLKSLSNLENINMSKTDLKRDDKLLNSSINSDQVKNFDHKVDAAKTMNIEKELKIKNQANNNEYSNDLTFKINSENREPLIQEEHSSSRKDDSICNIDNLYEEKKDSKDKITRINDSINTINTENNMNILKNPLNEVKNNSFNNQSNTEEVNIKNNENNEGKSILLNQLITNMKMKTEEQANIIEKLNTINKLGGAGPIRLSKLTSFDFLYIRNDSRIKDIVVKNKEENGPLIFSDYIYKFNNRKLKDKSKRILFINYNYIYLIHPNSFKVEYRVNIAEIISILIVKSSSVLMVFHFQKMADFLFEEMRRLELVMFLVQLFNSKSYKLFRIELCQTIKMSINDQKEKLLDFSLDPKNQLGKKNKQIISSMSTTNFINALKVIII